MVVRFECPHCNARLTSADAQRLLRPVVCPSCHTRFQPRVPQPAQSEIAVSAASAGIAPRPLGEVAAHDRGSQLDLLSQAPAHEEADATRPEPLFYKIDSRKVSLKEYWWGAKFNPLVLLVAWLIKLCRVQIPSSSDDPPVASLVPFEAAAEEIPGDVRAEFRPLIVELKALGFEDPVCHVIHDGHHRTTIHWVTLRHESGRAFVRCQRRYWQAQGRPRRYLFPTFVTAFRDRTYLTSTSARADLLWPPEVELHRDRKANATQLWEEHCRLLDDEAGGKRLRMIRDRRELEEVLDEYHELVSKFHVERGVFAKMSAAEEARARSAAPQDRQSASKARTSPIRTFTRNCKSSLIKSPIGCFSHCCWACRLSFLRCWERSPGPPRRP